MPNDIAFSVLKRYDAEVTNTMIVAKVGSNGEILDMFPLIKLYEYFSPPSFMFDIQSIDMMADNSFVVGAITTFLQNEFGVSADTSKDISLFYFDSNRDMRWVTSIDFINQGEENVDIMINDDILYIDLNIKN